MTVLRVRGFGKGVRSDTKRGGEVGVEKGYGGVVGGGGDVHV